MDTLRTSVPDLATLLLQIRHRPGLYVGGKSVQGLGQLLDGIRLAEDWHGVRDSDQFAGPHLRAFESWVEANHNPERLTRRSFSLAALAAGSDAAGFDRWFEWYDAFTLDRGNR